jgi:hypothetical protein
MISLRIHMSFIMAAALLPAHPIEAVHGKQAPTLVEVWWVGDDGLTNRLIEAIEKAFKASSDFHLSSGKRPGTLVVTIPSNVDWEQVGSRTKVLYMVEFGPVDSRKLRTSRGYCWEDMLTKCATQIVKDAKIAVKAMH